MFQLNRLGGSQGRGRQYCSMIVLISALPPLSLKKRKRCTPSSFLVGSVTKAGGIFLLIQGHDAL